MTVTLINPFVVPEDEEEAFLKSWKTTAEIFSKEPGYIDTKLHRSLDPTARFRFVNVAHWESQAAWRAAIKKAPPQEWALKIEANPALYDIIMKIDAHDV